MKNQDTKTAANTLHRIDDNCSLRQFLGPFGPLCPLGFNKYLTFNKQLYTPPPT